MERQDIPELLKQRDEAGLEALLVHYGPLLRYVAAPILPEGRRWKTASPKRPCGCGSRLPALIRKRAALPPG